MADMNSTEHGEAVQITIAKIAAALEEGDMGVVEHHLAAVQENLNEYPYLVDILLPSDVGVLVKAECARRDDDILSLVATKRKPKAPKTKVMSLEDLMAGAGDEF